MTTQKGRDPSSRREAFNQRVYTLCRKIPEGRVSTYGWIAAAIELPLGMEPLAFERIRARWVGYAMAGCPADIPWHRVINHKGGLSLRPGHEHQRALLEDEGVTFRASGTVDLEQYGWKPSRGTFA
jgi:methylated-DNA-protein-cysteine methyltransferase-like protein